MFFCVGCWWNQRALLRRKKAELPRQTHTHSPNFSKATDGGFIKKTAARLRLCRFFNSTISYCSFRPFGVLDVEPCRIRKSFRFTHHGFRHIAKKVCESTLVSKLPRMDSQTFFAAWLKKKWKLQGSNL